MKIAFEFTTSDALSTSLAATFLDLTIMAILSLAMVVDWTITTTHSLSAVVDLTITTIILNGFALIRNHSTIPTNSTTIFTGTIIRFYLDSIRSGKCNRFNLISASTDYVTDDLSDKNVLAYRNTEQHLPCHCLAKNNHR